MVRGGCWSCSCNRNCERSFEKWASECDGWRLRTSFFPFRFGWNFELNFSNFKFQTLCNSICMTVLSTHEYRTRQRQMKEPACAHLFSDRQNFKFYLLSGLYIRIWTMASLSMMVMNNDDDHDITGTAIYSRIGNVLVFEEKQQCTTLLLNLFSCFSFLWDVVKSLRFLHQFRR